MNPIINTAHNRRNLLISQSFAWFTQGLIYFGISYSSAQLGGNAYANFAITSTAEIPASLFGMWACERMGRKKTVVGTDFKLPYFRWRFDQVQAYFGGILK